MSTTFIHPTAIVDDGAVIEEGSKVWAYSHVRAKGHIGRNCVIGFGCSVEGILGDGVHVQNNVSIYDGVTIADGVFIGPHVVFTNDRWPRIGEPWTIERTLVLDHASLGANVMVRCGVVIGEYAMVAAGSVITADVMPYALMRGNPARHVGFVCRKGHPMENRSISAPSTYFCDRCRDGISLDVRYVPAGSDRDQRHDRVAADAR